LNYLLHSNATFNLHNSRSTIILESNPGDISSKILPIEKICKLALIRTPDPTDPRGGGFKRNKLALTRIPEAIRLGGDTGCYLHAVCDHVKFYAKLSHS